MIVRMIQSISVCDICGNEMSSSHYHLPAEIKEANKIKFVHMECCSADEIKKESSVIRTKSDQILS